MLQKKKVYEYFNLFTRPPSFSVFPPPAFTLLIMLMSTTRQQDTKKIIHENENLNRLVQFKDVDKFLKKKCVDSRGGGTRLEFSFSGLSMYRIVIDYKRG